MAKTGSIGIDVGGTKTRMGIFDDQFKTVASEKFKTPKAKDDFTSKLTRALRTLTDKAKQQSLIISALGIGFAGSIDRRKGTVQSAPNIPDLEGFSFRKVLANICRCDVS